MSPSSGVVLDTHVWVWWVNDSEALSKRARKAIEQAMLERTIHLSAISAWEIALLAERGRLELRMDVEDWIARTEALPFVQIVPVSIAIAVKSVRLPGEFHKDPADRMIITTAIRLGLPLVTKDEDIRRYPHVKTIW